MEQHPIPQNVTTFQFRLVGDMTIKQFGYLAGGIIVGYLCYKLPLPFFFTWPLAIASGLLGFGLAFVPIEERPMDVWIASFFKNIYNPTQWVWSRETRSGSAGQKSPPLAPARPLQKTPAPHVSPITTFLAVFTSALGPLLPSSKSKQTTAVTLPTTVPHVSKQPPLTYPPSPVPKGSAGAVLTEHQVFRPFEWLASLFRTKRPEKTVSLPAGFSFTDALASKQPPSLVGKHAASPSEPQRSLPELQPTKAPSPTEERLAQSSTAPSQSPLTHERVALLQGQLTEMMRDRERLEKELVLMRQQAQHAQPVTPPQPTRQASFVMPQSPLAGPTVRVIAPGATTGAGLPRLTTFPNIVTGIVKDQYGNFLAGILVTVRDKNDIPLRALKTNRLGQFAASTPLPNNTYIVEIEDPKVGFVFDKAQISLNGTIAPPIEVTAKSQKQVERDKLAKEIFGNQQSEFTITKPQ